MILILIVIYNNSPKLAGFREKYNLKNLIARLTKNRFSKHDADDTKRWDVVPTKIKMDEVLSVDLQVSSPYTPDKAGKEDK